MKSKLETLSLDQMGLGTENAAMVPDEWPIWGFGASRELAGSRNWVLGWGGVRCWGGGGVRRRGGGRATGSPVERWELILLLLIPVIQSKRPLSYGEGGGFFKFHMKMWSDFSEN